MLFQKVTIRSLNLVCLTLLLLSPGIRKAHAQDESTQRWQGVMDVQVAELTMNFDITKTGDEFSGTLGVVEQGADGIPITEIKFQDKKVTIKVESIKGSFEGTLNDDGTICTGTWTQLGKEYDLELRQVEMSDDKSGEHIETWKGTLAAGVDLELGLKVYRDKEGKLSATLDSYSQNALGIPVEFEKDGDTYKLSHKGMDMEFEGALNEDKSKIEGTFIQRGAEIPLELEKAELEYQPVLNRPQHPKAPFPYDSDNVEFENTKDDITLAGTLTTPKGDGPWPVAIMISGSGPQDRNETLLGHKPFLVIADHLTKQGIAVLRYDDRGVQESTGDFAVATSADFAIDVQAAMDFLKGKPKIDPTKIGLVGHSEGGLIAPMVAADRDDVAFIVMMAGPGVDGAEILDSQTDAMLEAAGESVAMRKANHLIYEAVFEVIKSSDAASAESIAAAAKSALKDFEDEKISEAMMAGAPAIGQMLSTPWMQYFVKYDPAENLKKVKCPTLAINGEKDLQVLVDLNLDAIEKCLTAGGNQNFKILRMPNMNHLFQETHGSGAPTDYGKIEETFSPKALKAISEWIESVVK